MTAASDRHASNGRLRSSVALAVVFLSVAVVARSEPSLPTYELHCNDGRHGSGFLAEDWSVPGDRLLMTSLHVVSGCSRLTAFRTSCSDGRIKNGVLLAIAPGSEIRVWPSLDLAAISILATDPLLAGETVPPARLAIDATPPTGGEQIVILGRDAFTFCPRVFGQVQHLVEIGDLSTRLAASQGPTAAQMQGSLAPRAIAMVYTAPLEKGASGSPVLLMNGSEAVLGVHMAGYTGRPTGWALLLGALTELADELSGQPVYHRLGDPDWPAFDPPGLGQAAIEKVADEVDAAVRAFQADQLAAYAEVAEFLKGFTFWAKEVLIKYDRYAAEAVREVYAIPERGEGRPAELALTASNLDYEPFGRLAETGTGDRLRARLRTLWGPNMAARYDVLFSEAVALHRGAMFPTSEINQEIRSAAATSKRRTREPLVQAIQKKASAARRIYVPRIDVLRQSIDEFIRRLEDGLRLLGVDVSAPA